MDYRIGFASKQEIPLLCEIWKSCFSDSDEYINYFYAENFDRIKVITLYVNGKPVSMVHMFDALFVDGKSSNNATFLYAGGTLPQYRRYGYFSAVLEHAKNLAKQSGNVLFFKPATRSLSDFYSTLGFSPDSFFRLVTVEPGEILPVAVSDISFKEYNRMRNAAFSSVPYVKWEDSHIKWCVNENRYFSGRTLKIKYEENEFFVMGYPSENTLVINETNMSVAQLRLLSGALCDLFNTEHLEAYLSDRCDEGEKIVSSIVYNGPLRNTYVNQILI